MLAPWFAERFKRTAFAPKLKLQFELTPPYCIRTSWGPPRFEPVYYFRFRVVNEGASQALLCEAVLEELWTYDSSGSAKKLANFSAINLPWSINRNTQININSHRNFYCDIGHISSRNYQDQVERPNLIFIDFPGDHGNVLRFLFDEIAYPHSQPSCLVPGKYCIQVALYSENAGYQKHYFQISWSGKWQDTEVDMFRELVIKQVSRP